MDSRLDRTNFDAWPRTAPLVVAAPPFVTVKTNRGGGQLDFSRHMPDDPIDTRNPTFSPWEGLNISYMVSAWLNPAEENAIAPAPGGGPPVLRMKCAIEHKGCWMVDLAKSPYVKELKVFSGIMLSPVTVMGSFSVHASQAMDVVEYFPFPLEYVNVEEEVLRDGHLYFVDYVVRDSAGTSTINLLFSSGVVFNPPATVRNDYEIPHILSPTVENLRRLKRKLEEKKRSFRILSLREVPSLSREAQVSWRKPLTPRQLEALLAAYRGGFYSYPRGARMVDLAQLVGLSRSTFQEHLRLAEVKLIQHLLGTEEADGGAHR